VNEELRNDEVVEQAEGEPSVEARLAQAEAKAEEHLDDLKRLAAEFDNYRKRTAGGQKGRFVLAS
jgi:molecular chaperone GrpE (heat shock protein)